MPYFNSIDHYVHDNVDISKHYLVQVDCPYLHDEVEINNKHLFAGNYEIQAYLLDSLQAVSV